MRARNETEKVRLIVFAAILGALLAVGLTRPSANLTRGQTAKIVVIAAGLPAPPGGRQTFQDVPEGSTFWTWIEELASTGAINGYTCGGPGQPCVPPLTGHTSGRAAT